MSRSIALDANSPSFVVDSVEVVEAGVSAERLSPGTVGAGTVVVGMAEVVVAMAEVIDEE